MEQLINTMPPSIRVWVSERKPTTVEQAGQLADHHIRARKRNPEDSQRGNSDKPSMGKGGKHCTNCGRSGHWTRESKSAKSNPGTPMDSPAAEKGKSHGPKCYSCQIFGYITAKCKLTLSGGSSNYHNNYHTMEQQNWEKESHSGITCSGMVEGVPVSDIVLDTGATRTVIRETLVPKGRCLVVVCLFAVVMGLLSPLARIQIEIGGKAYSVEAAISNQLPMAVLLGRAVPELVDVCTHKHVNGHYEGTIEERDIRTGEDATKRRGRWCNCDTGRVWVYLILTIIFFRVAESEDESRRERRIAAREFIKKEVKHPLDFDLEKLRSLQQEDVLKQRVRAKNTSTCELFLERGTLYRR